MRARLFLCLAIASSSTFGSPVVSGSLPKSTSIYIRSDTVLKNSFADNTDMLALVTGRYGNYDNSIDLVLLPGSKQTTPQDIVIQAAGGLRLLVAPRALADSPIDRLAHAFSMKYDGKADQTAVISKLIEVFTSTLKFDRAIITGSGVFATNAFKAFIEKKITADSFDLLSHRVLEPDERLLSLSIQSTGAKKLNITKMVKLSPAFYEQYDKSFVVSEE